MAFFAGFFFQSSCRFLFEIFRRKTDQIKHIFLYSTVIATVVTILYLLFAYFMIVLLLLLFVDSLKTIIIFWIYAIIQFQKWHNKFPKTTNDKHGVQTRCQITVAISLVLLSILCVPFAWNFLFVHIFGRFLRCRFQLTSLYQAHANQVKCL